MNALQQKQLAAELGIESARCPSCSKVAKTTDDLIEDFGIRVMGNNSVRPQSYCYDCRSLHAKQQRELRAAIAEGFVDLDESEFSELGDMPFIPGTDKDAKDYQQQAVYSAESAAWQSVKVKTPNKMLDIGQSADFVVQKLLRSEWYKRRVGVDPCRLEIKADRGNWFYRPGEKTIYLKRTAGNKVWIIIHEFAHHVVNIIQGHKRSKGQGRVSAHGAFYTAVYLELVEEFLGKSAHKALADAFEKDGIDVANLS
jgi:hypothetical protein